MTQFPVVDPIPLPAPVWLFKILHNLTFILHLSSVDLLVGGLVLAIAFSLSGRAQAAGLIIHRLPTLMAFVINLGVPPLLFAQVLYGRALYTSSVLIGFWWISVIGLLMASYYGLYAAAKRADSQRQWRAPAFAALLLILTIAFIYSNNMSLMIRPEVWATMYRTSPGGLQLNLGDPTLPTRWLFFIAGAFPVAGAALALMSLRHGLTGMTRSGGIAIMAGTLIESVFAWMASAAQPAGVLSAVMADPLYRPCVLAWGGTALLMFLLGLVLSANAAAKPVVSIVAAVVAFLNVAATVMVRDGIRDFTLRAAGFEVWNRQVATNWSVVSIFLVLFVAALCVIGYLVTVLAKADKLQEAYV
jgi:hypothetical protein